MHVPFKIHYRNNLIDKKDSYLISRPPSWDDRNYSYGHQLYPSEVVSEEKFFECISHRVQCKTMFPAGGHHGCDADLLETIFKGGRPRTMVIKLVLIGPVVSEENVFE